MCNFGRSRLPGQLQKVTDGHPSAVVNLVAIGAPDLRKRPLFSSDESISTICFHPQESRTASTTTLFAVRLVRCVSMA